MKDDSFMVEVVPNRINKNSVYPFLNELGKGSMVKLGKTRPIKANTNHIASV